MGDDIRRLSGTKRDHISVSRSYRLGTREPPVDPRLRGSQTKIEKLFLCPPKAGCIIDPTTEDGPALERHRSMMISDLAGQRSTQPRPSARKDLGDFQTPRPLVDAILGRILAGGERFERVLRANLWQRPVSRRVAGCARLSPASCWASNCKPTTPQAARAVVGDRGRIFTPTCSSLT